MRKLTLLLSAALAVAVTSSSAFAQLIAYESFGDAATTNLDGTTADSGLGAWTLVNGVAGSATYTTPGLTYTNLDTSGNKVTVTTGTALYANLSSIFTVAPDSVGDLWGSFIMSTSNTSGDAALSIFQTASPTASTGALATIGMVNTTNARLIAGRNMDGGGNSALATSSVAANQQNLYVFRLTIDTNAGQGESASFWINPTITAGMTVGDLGTAAGSWTVGNTGLSTVASIGLYTTGTNDAVFDEIRLGNTLSDVAVIPEPSTWALLAIGFTALTIYRRRRMA